MSKIRAWEMLALDCLLLFPIVERVVDSLLECNRWLPAGCLLQSFDVSNWVLSLAGSEFFNLAACGNALLEQFADVTATSDHSTSHVENDFLCFLLHQCVVGPHDIPHVAEIQIAVESVYADTCCFSGKLAGPFGDH